MTVFLKAAFSGDLDAMELDLGGSQHHFTTHHSFHNLLEDISTDENSDIPMMVSFVGTFFFINTICHPK